MLHVASPPPLSEAHKVVTKAAIRYRRVNQNPFNVEKCSNNFFNMNVFYYLHNINPRMTMQKDEVVG